MPICVVVLTKAESAKHFLENLRTKTFPLRNYSLVKPSIEAQSKKNSNPDLMSESSENYLQGIKPMDIKNIKLLNPKLARKTRQRTLAAWLMPFGFLAGLSFSQMTNLNTFQNLGAPEWSEALAGGILGMCSGLIGSFTAAASIKETTDKGIKKLLKSNSEGKWLLILETPLGIELPWDLIKEVNPEEIIQINES